MHKRLTRADMRPRKIALLVKVHDDKGVASTLLGVPDRAN
jgi:hypothetical protein